MGVDTEWWYTDYPRGGRNIAAPYARSQDINVDFDNITFEKVQK